VNSFGTVQLFDVAEPHDVKVLGELLIPDLGRGLSEELPIGFDREGRIMLATSGALFIVDLSNVMAPRMLATHLFEPAMRNGTFVDGVLYRSALGANGLFAHDGGSMLPFAPDLPDDQAPVTFARRGDFVYSISNADDLVVYRADDLTRVRSIKCDVAYDAYTLTADELGLIVVVSSTKLHIIDVEKPDKPKLQKKVYGREAKGAGIAGSTLLVVDGEYQEAQSLTRIKLARPASSAGERVAFTEDPELGSGLLVLEQHGSELFVMTTTGRFAVLAPPS
jgi:hypothetical protein